MATDPSLFDKPLRRRAEIVLFKYLLNDTDASKRFTVSALADREYIVYVSEAAKKKLLKKITTQGIKHQGSFKGLRIEHMVPTHEVMKHFAELHESGRLCVAAIEEVAQRLHCAIITKKENGKLDRKHRSSMPKGWKILTGDITERYKSVGIDLIKLA